VDERQALAAIRNAVRLEGLSEDVARRVAPQLREIFTELGKQFRAMPPGNIEREVWYRQQRLRIAELFRAPNEELRGYLQATLGDEVYRQMHFAESYLKVAGEDPETLISATMPQDGVNINMNSGPTSIGRGVQFTREQLHQITQETRVLGERLDDLFTSTIDNDTIGPWIKQNIGLIDRVVKTGFLTGQTADQVAAQIPGLDREAMRRNKAIARTALMDMSARAQEAFWLANSDVVAGFEFDSSLDDRVCHLCAPWNGKFAEKITQLPKTPVHVNCRCRVLPLTHAEMLLREEEGEQRQTVMELIEAKSKDDAIAKAKLKPDAVGARAYASQVKYKGKKYWRVAVDLKRPSKPYTMGDFLKQASPQTQAKVLGSEKRAREFMRKVLGTKDKAPISPDRALREVVNFRPVITRQPRLSMEMKLDISRLKSQKELMKKNSEGDAHIVYGYLRAKDSGTAAAGTPYYIGIGNSHTRAFQVHSRGGKRSALHNVPVPKNEALVRQFGVFPTREAAAKREQELIARYGRKGIDEKGVLLNRTLGGEGRQGRGVRELKLLKKNAEKMGIAFERYKALSKYERKLLQAKYAGGARDPDVLFGIKNSRTVAAVQKYGITAEKWDALSEKQKAAVLQRYQAGHRGADLFVDHRVLHRAEMMRKAARRMGIDEERYMRLPAAARSRISGRYRDGIRGDALFAETLAPNGVTSQMATAANKYNVPPRVWADLTASQRSRFKTAMSREQNAEIVLFSVVNNISIKVIKSARMVGVDERFFASLAQHTRDSVMRRYRRGIRGKALLEGLI